MPKTKAFLASKTKEKKDPNADAFKKTKKKVGRRIAKANATSTDHKTAKLFVGQAVGENDEEARKKSLAEALHRASSHSAILRAECSHLLTAMVQADETVMIQHTASVREALIKQLLDSDSLVRKAARQLLVQLVSDDQNMKASTLFQLDVARTCLSGMCTGGPEMQDDCYDSLISLLQAVDGSALVQIKGKFIECLLGVIGESPPDKGGRSWRLRTMPGARRTALFDRTVSAMKSLDKCSDSLGTRHVTTSTSSHDASAPLPPSMYRHTSPAGGSLTSITSATKPPVSDSYLWLMKLCTTVDAGDDGGSCQLLATRLFLVLAQGLKLMSIHGTCLDLFESLCSQCLSKTIDSLNTTMENQVQLSSAVQLSCGTLLIHSGDNMPTDEDSVKCLQSIVFRVAILIPQGVGMGDFSSVANVAECAIQCRQLLPETDLDSPESVSQAIWGAVSEVAVTVIGHAATEGNVNLGISLISFIATILERQFEAARLSPSKVPLTLQWCSSFIKSSVRFLFGSDQSLQFSLLALYSMAASRVRLGSIAGRSLCTSLKGVFKVIKTPLKNGQVVPGPFFTWPGELQQQLLLTCSRLENVDESDAICLAFAFVRQTEDFSVASMMRVLQYSRLAPSILLSICVHCIQARPCQQVIKAALTAAYVHGGETAVRRLVQASSFAETAESGAQATSFIFLLYYASELAPSIVVEHFQDISGQCEGSFRNLCISIQDSPEAMESLVKLCKVSPYVCNQLCTVLTDLCNNLHASNSNNGSGIAGSCDIDACLASCIDYLMKHEVGALFDDQSAKSLSGSLAILQGRLNPNLQSLVQESILRLQC